MDPAESTCRIRTPSVALTIPLAERLTVSWQSTLRRCKVDPSPRKIHTHRGFAYRHLHAAGCLLRLREARGAVAAGGRDEDVEVVFADRHLKLNGRSRFGPCSGHGGGALLFDPPVMLVEPPR